MNGEPFPGCIIQLILFVLCGTLTLMSAALEDLSLNNLRREADDSKKSAALAKIKEKESSFIVGCHFWFILMTVVVGIITWSYLLPTDSAANVLADIGIVLLTAFVGITISRITPLRVALKNPEKTAESFCGLMRLVNVLSVIPVGAAVWLGKLLAALFGVAPDEDLEDVTEEEIRMMVDIGTESGAIAPEEQEFIQNIFEFDNMSAADVMTHRTDVAVLKMGEDPREWEKVVRDCGFSRFPVCGNGIDDIVGVVQARELYEFLYDGSGSVMSIIRPAYVVPETVRADVLFRNMQKEKNPIAIVVDEYGGFSGIVTIDDLLEELVGRIVDEKDEQLEPEEEIVRLDDGTWSVDGTAPLDDISEELGVDLPTEEYDTIGGMIFAQMDKIPEDGSAFEIEAYGLLMKVTKISDRRIERVLVCIAEPAEELESSENTKQG